MSKLTLKEISKAIRALDVAMLTTRNPEGMLETRPMSNNKDVDYNGDSYYFTLAHTRTAQDIENDPTVCLSFDGRPSWFGKHMYVSVGGYAEVIRDKTIMKNHWVPDLELWFKEGVDTPGLVLIHVSARHIKYWNGFEEGEVALDNELKHAA